VWFTDPTFGILGYYEGHKAESDNKPAVYRLDAATGKLTMMVDEVAGPKRPRLLTRREKSSISWPSRAEPAPHHRLLRPSRADGTKLSGGAGADRCRAGRLGPMASASMSTANLWCGWGMGFARARRALAPYSISSGKPIGHIDLPERAANLCFGGTLPQPAVHRGEPFALRPLRQHAGASPAADRKKCRVSIRATPGGGWAASVALSTVGRHSACGAWPSLCRRCRSISASSRADISFAYTMNMLGFFAGGRRGRQAGGSPAASSSPRS